MTDIDFSSLQPDEVDVPDGFGVPNPDKAPKTETTATTKEEPKKRGRGRSPKETKPAPPKRRGQFKQPLTQMYAGIGTFLAIQDPVCGKAVLESAEKCAETLDDWAYQNPAVRRALASLTETSAVTAVIMAHAPIVMTVLMHHSPAAQKALGGMNNGKSVPDPSDSEGSMGGKPETGGTV